MPSDISKLQKKTEINLSKPFHSGPLLVDLKSTNSKSLIDIKPIRKIKVTQSFEANSSLSDQSNSVQELVEKNENVENIQKPETKSATLDFDKLHDFEDHLNPFLQADAPSVNRDAGQIQINQLPEDLKSEQSLKPESNTVLISDFKKMETELSNISFSKWQPKIKVAPLHSRCRSLAVSDQNRSLIKKLKAKYRKENIDKIPDSHRSDLKNFTTNTDQFNFATDLNDNLFQFKAPQKFDASDIPQFADQAGLKSNGKVTDRVNLSELNKELSNSNLRKKLRTINKIKRYSTSTLFTTVIVIFCTLFLTGNAQWMGKFGDKNAQANKNQNLKTQNFEKWIAQNNAGQYSTPGSDLDKDGLNNYEEFLIGSNPANPHTCNTSVSDNQNLLNLIDPVSCLPIDFDLPGQVQRFESVLNLTPEFIQKHQSQTIQNQSYESSLPKVISPILSISTSSAALITDILPIPNSEIDKDDMPKFIEASVEIKAPNLVLSKSIEISSVSSVTAPIVEKKVEVKEPELPTPKSNFNVGAVQQYIDQYRSYDKFDNQAANPVNADYFIDMASRYNVPMKYVLALARSESRFGTDQFNQDGSSNRIGRHLNMYSIGLDDDGGSITYPSWEAGVDAFGRWYSKHENRGYSDCAKWRIYNPNGDYCQKIENLAGQIENYIAN